MRTIKRNILNDEIFEKLFNINLNESVNNFNLYINNYSKSLLMDEKYILKQYINYILLDKTNYLNDSNILDVKFIYNNLDNKFCIKYLHYLFSIK